MFSSDDELPDQRSSRSPSSSPPALAGFRKRSYGEASAASSDMPFFSSDDLADASIDDYLTPRRKKQYRRTWWESGGEASNSRKDGLKRASKRSKDSGVFMPSSDSSGMEEGFNHDKLKPPATPPRWQTAVRTKPFSPKNAARLGYREEAQRVINECLDNNDDNVDLENQGIEAITNDLIRPLHNLIALPKFQANHRDEHSYKSFTPKIKLFLAKNLLTRLPSEIVNLNNLTLLSLRNNQLTELPCSIGKLRNLMEINVSLNRLRWLPYEFLHLVGGEGKLTQINTALNPWLRATTAPDTDMTSPPFQSPPSSMGPLEDQIDELREAPELQARSVSSPILRQLWALWIKQEVARRKAALPPDTPLDGRGSWNDDATSRIAPHHAWKKDPIYLGSSHITFFNSDGTLTAETAKNFPRPSTLAEEVAVVPVQRNGPTPLPTDCTNTVQQGNAPSLFALALKTCASSLFLSDVDADLPAQTPDQVRRALHLAKEAAEEGGWKCTACPKTFILPAAEWLEYWHCSPDVSSLPRATSDDLYLPFLRRSCSWRCAIDVQRARATEEIA